MRFAAYHYWAIFMCPPDTEYLPVPPIYVFPIEIKSMAAFVQL